MKTISRIAFASCAMLLVVSSSFADNATNQLPTIAEIDAEIAGLANQCGAKILWREFESTVGKIKDLQDSFPTQEVLQVQWHVVSNMFSECYPVSAVTNGNQVDYYGIRLIAWRHLVKYRLFHADTNTVMYVADCISNAQPVDVSREEAVVQVGMSEVYMPEFGSTNALTGERVVLDYHSSTNRVRVWWQWEGLRRAKSCFNRGVKRFRQEAFNCFCTLILCELVEYPETVRQDLWEEFCRRAGASDSEKSEAHSERHVIRLSTL